MALKNRSGFIEEEIAAQGYVWAFEFGPLFIVNGEKTGLSAFSGRSVPPDRHRS